MGQYETKGLKPIAKSRLALVEPATLLGQWSRAAARPSRKMVVHLGVAAKLSFKTHPHMGSSYRCPFRRKITACLPIPIIARA